MKPRLLLTAGPDFILGAWAVLVWLAPALFGGTAAVMWFGLFYISEFFVTHASAFIGHFLLTPQCPGRGWYLLLFGMVYTFFMAMVSDAYRSWMPLFGFWMLLANRLMTPLLGKLDGEEIYAGFEMTIARNGGVFLASALFGLLPLPRLGVTMPILAPTGKPAEDAHKMLAMCAFYFLVQGWITVRLARREEREAA